MFIKFTNFFELTENFRIHEHFFLICEHFSNIRVQLHAAHPMRNRKAP